MDEIFIDRVVLFSYFGCVFCFCLFFVRFILLIDLFGDFVGFVVVVFELGNGKGREGCLV